MRVGGVESGVADETVGEGSCSGRNALASERDDRREARFSRIRDKRLLASFTTSAEQIIPGTAGIFDPGAHLLFLGKFVIAREFVAIEIHAEARALGHGHFAVLIFQLAAFENVVGEMVIVRIGEP